jgi:hypothetical protein
VLTAFLLRRRSTKSVPVEDPAAELRRKLAAARDAEPAAPYVPPPPPAEPAAPADADARRREVHEQARAAIDEMTRGDD